MYAAIREFASAGKIGYVHFRNTSGQLPRYSEVFIDDGYVDMPRALAIYRECGFDGTVMPDHTPRLEAIHKFVKVLALKLDLNLQTLFFWPPKSLQMVTAAMKLKDGERLKVGGEGNDRG